MWFTTLACTGGKLIYCSPLSHLLRIKWRMPNHNSKSSSLFCGQLPLGGPWADWAKEQPFLFPVSMKTLGVWSWWGFTCNDFNGCCLNWDWVLHSTETSGCQDELTTLYGFWQTTNNWEQTHMASAPTDLKIKCRILRRKKKLLFASSTASRNAENLWSPEALCSTAFSSRSAPLASCWVYSLI